ncbi:MAG: hypothetical protein AMXMBFR61_22820 [Fimbriimonadales bacterium]
MPHSLAVVRVPRFDVERVAEFGRPDAERLLGDASIIRNRRKIENRRKTESTVENARIVLGLTQERGSLAN